MTDMFTITRTYDRDEIFADVQKVIDKGGQLFQARLFLDSIHSGWSRDERTLIMVELMFRGEGDILYDVFTRKLAELNEKEGV